VPVRPHPDDASRREIKRIWLTASGGPFRTRPKETFDSITREEALKHPTWDMGPRITIGSATMTNKAFEILEAHWLFGVAPEQIEVLVHPQSIVHSMVEFVDGSIIAQLGVPDMRVPILYCLGWPERLPFGGFEPFDPQALRPAHVRARRRRAFSRRSRGLRGAWRAAATQGPCSTRPMRS
jgi:1-deoxy-D-xylulose-5-phosphate reductoisomerase